MLPISLQPTQVVELADFAADAQRFTVDLNAQRIAVGNSEWEFDIAPEQRLALLNGWDETKMILKTREADISAFEARQRSLQPWLWENA